SRAQSDGLIAAPTRIHQLVLVRRRAERIVRAGTGRFGGMEARQLPCLAGKHVLVVEDIYLEAQDVRRAVESAAGSVLGPASSIDQALWWIKRHQPDCGILDVGIGPLPTTPVAQRLDELKVPYIVAPGFSREVIPPPLRSAPYLAKPFLREQLIESVLRSMCRPIAAESSTLEEPPTKRN